MRVLSFRAATFLVAVISILLSAVTCRSDRPAASSGEPLDLRRVLPAPRTAGGMGLMDALSQRRSIRSYEQDSLSLEQLSQLLWSAQGITDSRGFRTVPSAGALYPFEIYLAADRVEGLQPGLYHYQIGDHRLVPLRYGHFNAELSRLALGQGSVAQAAASVILMADVSRTAPRYGDRAEQYIWMEGGGIVLAISLQAVDLGLGAVCIGAFVDADLQRFIGVDLLPVAVIPVGRPLGR